MYNTLNWIYWKFENLEKKKILNNVATKKENQEWDVVKIQLIGNLIGKIAVERFDKKDFKETEITFTNLSFVKEDLLFLNLQKLSRIFFESFSDDAEWNNKDFNQIFIIWGEKINE